MRGSLLVVAMVLGLGARGYTQTNCSTFNQTFGPHTYNSSDTRSGIDTRHFIGTHNWANAMTGTCTYTGSAQVGISVPCHPYAQATTSSGISDTGVTTPYFHTPSPAGQNGSADGTDGGTATADAEGAVAVNSCALFPCGSLTITFKGSRTGGGFAVGFPQSSLWNDQNYYKNTCTAYSLPPLETASTCPYPNPSSPPGMPMYGYTWTWNTQVCTWQQVPNNSPILIDTTKQGLHLSDPAKGRYVTFDLHGDGNYERLS